MSQASDKKPTTPTHPKGSVIGKIQEQCMRNADHARNATQTQEERK